MTSTHDNGSHRRRPWALFYRLSFANKILVATLVLLVLLGSTGTVIFWRVLRARLSDEFATRARMLATESASRAGPMLVRGDADGLARLVRGLKSVDESIGYVVVIDRDGRIVAHTFSWDPPEAVLALEREPSPLGEGGFRRIEIEGEAYLGVAAPVLSGARGAGSLLVGVRTARIDHFILQVNLVFLLVLLGLTCFGMLAAHVFYRRMTRPIVELTHLADEVSTGNLDAEFDFGFPVRCWEIKHCGRTDCVAYGDTSVQCWFVDGTPCEGYESRFPRKLAGCRTCEVYRAHKGDEIVQLADSFRHMTHVLKASRTELERSDRFLRSLIQNSYIGIFATDETDTVRIFNRVAQNLTGLAEDEVAGVMTWEQLFVRETIPRWHGEPLGDGSGAIFGFYRRELSLVRKEGGSVAVRATGATLFEEGRPIGKVFFVMDLREVQSLREDLIRSERLAATGQTVASISHSIKNILEGLRGGAYIYRRGVRVEDPEVRTKGWATVEKNIDLISELVSDLLNFARDREPGLEACDPNELVTDVLENLAAKAEKLDVTLEAELAPEASPSRLDLHTMHQCLTNLVTNAIDAVGGDGGGRVVVKTEVEGEIVEFVVSDDGPGVAQEVADDLFSGMVSTKGSKGTGLGLLVVSKIVNEHGGTVILDRKTGPGAVFRIRLPRWGREKREGLELARAAPSEPAGTG